MYPKLKTAATVGVVLTGLFGLVRTGMVSAQEETEIPRSSRGGILATAEGHRFEIFFYPTGARVFPLDGTGKPTDASRLAGGATFYHPNAPGRPWFSRPLHHEPTAAGQAPTSLDLNIDLSKAPQNGASVVFEITGLTGHAGSTVTFKVPLEFAATTAPQPTAPQGEIAAGPRYTYGPGYYGYGYYANPGPETVPQPAQKTPTYFGSSSGSTGYGSMSGHSVGFRHRDWSTGRDNLPLAKPWLRPMD